MVQLQRNLELANNLALFLLSMLVFSCSRPPPRPCAPRAVDFRRQVTHGPPPSFHIAWKKPRRCQPLCTPPNQDARLKWRLWLDFRCPASHFSCLRCSFLMFIFDEEIHSNSYLMTRKYHLNGCARSTHDQHSLVGPFPCTDKHVQWSPAFMPRSFLLIIFVPTQRNSFASPSVRSDLFVIVRTQSTHASRSLAGLFSVSVCISRGAAHSYFRSTFCLCFSSGSTHSSRRCVTAVPYPACRFIRAGRPDNGF